MRVALLNTFDINGGAARAVFRLYQGLGRIGIDRILYVARKDGTEPNVVFVRPDTPGELADWQKREDAIRAEEAFYPTLDNRNLFHSERAARADLLESRMQASDVIHLHWTRGLVDWKHFLAARPPGQALIWTLHDQQTFTGGCHYSDGCEGYIRQCGCCPILGSSRPDDLSATVLARKASALTAFHGPLHIVTPSRWMAAEAARSTLLRDRPVHVIPNGLDTQLFSPVDGSSVRDRLGIDRSATVVLFVSHDLTSPRKGFAYLRAALDTLHDPEGIVLVTVGQGHPELPARVPVISLGPVDSEPDLVPLYSMADLVAIPSDQDNYPNVALEALACGSAVLGFATGGLPDIVGDGERGLLAKTVDGASFAQALAAVLSDRCRLAGWGRAGRAFIEQECSLERQASRYADLYVQALAEARLEEKTRANATAAPSR